MAVSVLIGEIQEITNTDRWYLVEGKVNVADRITRDKKHLNYIVFGNRVPCL